MPVKFTQTELPGVLIVESPLFRDARGFFMESHNQYTWSEQGSLFGMAVELRRDSPTFGKWTRVTLSQENGLAQWVSVGFAHGFPGLDDNTPQAERSVLSQDPEIGIAWPETPLSISEKHEIAPTLAEAEYNFVYATE